MLIDALSILYATKALFSEVLLWTDLHLIVLNPTIVSLKEFPLTIVVRPFVYNLSLDVSLRSSQSVYL